jgi:uncharacterized protein (TIGR00297 family)
MNPVWLYALLGVAAGALLAWLGGRLTLLTRSGQVATWLVVVAIFAAGGWVWGALIVLCMAAGGLAMGFRRPYKAYLTGRYGAQAAQNWLQVTARFGWPAILAMLSIAAPRADYLIPLVGALATAGADIWATELGMLYRKDPLLITTRRPAPHGTPGAISLMGVTAALGATWLLGFVGLVLASLDRWQAQNGIERDLLWLPLAAMLGGMVGNLTDSLLGATAQAVYHCEICDRYTDQPVHTCGRPTNQVRGWPWMTNDMVDMVSVVVGAAVTTGVAILLAQSRWTW